jgi:hypothetical protein
MLGIIEDRKLISFSGGKFFPPELQLVTALGCFQLLFAAGSYIFKLVEYYPVIIARALKAETKVSISRYFALESNNSVNMVTVLEH